MTYREEFPDFQPATMPQIPSGFDDVSWHNDTCPSFLDQASGLIIFVDYADASEREFPECPRFTLGIWEDGNTGNDIVSTDDWQEVLAHVIARRFADTLRSELRPDDFEEIQRRNATADYANTGACASHDFCDANMPMSEAFSETVGHEIEADSMADALLWSNAWTIARRDYLTAKPTEPEAKFIALADMDAWESFWRDNAESLSEQVGDKETCFKLACNCELVIGGGAAPLYRVGFVD